MDGEGADEGVAAERRSPLLHVTPHTVSEWARRGDLTAGRTPGGHLRIPNDEVLRLYRSRRP